MNNETKRADGLRAGRESSVSSSRPQEVEMMATELREGQWAVFQDGSYSLCHSVKRIAKVSPKIVKFIGHHYPRQVARDAVRAAYDDERTADRVCQSINGAAGEYSRRRNAADEERARRLADAAQAAERAIERIIRDSDRNPEGEDPQGLRAEHESAGPQGIAQTNPGDPS